MGQENMGIITAILQMKSLKVKLDAYGYKSHLWQAQILRSDLVILKPVLPFLFSTIKLYN